MTDWSSKYYYDESSPSCLRFRENSYFGKSDSIVRVSADDPAGYFNSTLGYFFCKSGGKLLRCHRIIWELHHGAIPDGKVVDHIDQDTTNNKISNLRCVEPEINRRNSRMNLRNKTGVTGVARIEKESRGKMFTYWQVRWCPEMGKSKTKLFSVLKYGEDTARRMAIDFRQQKMEEMVANGLGYTERHGKEGG